MSTLAGKTVFVTGATRGIGYAIAMRAAIDGANVVVAGKTAEPHAKLPGTIFTAAQEMEDVGGQTLAVAVDVRVEAQVDQAIEAAVSCFGGIDILVNNASAISLTRTLDTPMKRYDLMHEVNVRGTFMCSQKALPHLLKSSNPHILNIAPPLHSTISPRWFGPHLAYTMSKYGMSLCVLGMAEEFREQGVAVNALWPRTTIDTEAIRLIAGQEARRRARSPLIMSDAAYWILTQPSRKFTGRFFVDDEVLRNAGVSDFSKYRQPDVAESDLTPDFFL
ncbi:MAG TPA: NAD(P)-dependent oxidoreductase [Vicinamibacterales bacterium]|nr:NAD(P)-dependent oxidoreductase [Vicinamibacterales bacterium]